jgi:hypothetical protein
MRDAQSCSSVRRGAPCLGVLTRTGRDTELDDRGIVGNDGATGRDECRADGRRFACYH